MFFLGDDNVIEKKSDEKEKIFLFSQPLFGIYRGSGLFLFFIFFFIYSLSLGASSDVSCDISIRHIPQCDKILMNSAPKTHPGNICFKFIKRL